MHHIAIMNKSWKLIPKILSGEKSIESRWYQTRRLPWNGACAGDTVFFKDSGELVTAKAVVSEVMQFEIGSLADARAITEKYGKEICLVNPDPKAWGKLPKYCILLRLRDPEPVEPFQIDKKGFGTGAAWMTVEGITEIKIS
jgi:hypothetical protein